eukprot:TRINITY_DN3013_c0_g1_i2.p1 TRINITY_DN3013_c0_g1~~TRINITY_DN3013_c0_g1_i2.p1  ORF type:complete len:101 (+),score=18.62 TRINITY_DN3013_c0_g1_i2:78-380(+)
MDPVLFNQLLNQYPKVRDSTYNRHNSRVVRSEAKEQKRPEQTLTVESSSSSSENDFFVNLNKFLSYHYGTEKATAILANFKASYSNLVSVYANQPPAFLQ